MLSRPAPPSQAQGQTEAVTAAIIQHRNTYVTAADFKLLASQGINSVRLGVGYWVMAETQVRPVNEKPELMSTVACVVPAQGCSAAPALPQSLLTG